METAIFMDREVFLEKVRSKQMELIAHKGSYSIPPSVLSESIPKCNVVEIASFVDGIKVSYYLPIGVDSLEGFTTCDTHSYSIVGDELRLVDDWTRTSYSVPLNKQVRLYQLTTLEEWKKAIQMAYEMVIKCPSDKVLYFTDDDVYEKLTGKFNDIGCNVKTGVNRLLKQNGIKKQISLSGCDRGSHVSINEETPDITFKLYQSPSLYECEKAIQMAYGMVITCPPGEELYFTYDNVYEKLTGKLNDIGRTVMVGVNQLLKQHGIKKRISLFGCDCGSHVLIEPTSTKEEGDN